jgi:hypothetical protein
MGGDGGVFAVNRKFFAACRNTSKDGQTDATENEERQIKLCKRFVKCRTCAISGEELVAPIVTCRLGYLYTKENLLTGLLEKTLHSNFSHIKGLKHVKELILTPNSEYLNTTSSSSSGDSIISGSGSSVQQHHQHQYTQSKEAGGEMTAQYMCPVTQQQLNGVSTFVAIWTTGHVLSEKAIREIGIEGLQLEYGPFAQTDIITLLPVEEELNTRRATLEAQAEVLRKKNKEEKKRNRDQLSSETGVVLLTSEAGKKQSKSSKKSIKAIPKTTKATNSVKLDSSGSIVSAAKTSIADSKKNSELYDKLFHKDKDSKKSGRDLFMSVAGIRYTL